MIGAESVSAGLNMAVGVDAPEMGRTAAGGRSWDQELATPSQDRLAMDQTEINHGYIVCRWLTKRLPSTTRHVARCNGLKSEGMS